MVRKKGLLLLIKMRRSAARFVVDHLAGQITRTPLNRADKIHIPPIKPNMYLPKKWKDPCICRPILEKSRFSGKREIELR